MAWSQELKGVRVATLTGEALRASLPSLAGLRIEVFRAYPYLYEGDLAYESRYIETFSKATGAVVVGASDIDSGDIIGAATGAPMIGQMDAWAAPFRERGYELEKLFYCGESVLRASYRGRGIGHAFFDAREAQARTLGATHCCFCGVIRPDDHPARPGDYVPLNGFWRKRGYEPLEGVQAEFEWKEVGAEEETPHRLQFWIRSL